MTDLTGRVCAELEDHLATIDGVARLYGTNVLTAVARPLVQLLTSGGAGSSRVLLRDGVVTVMIGTAPGSIARDVAHEVHEVARAFLRANGLPVVRVEVTIATIGI